jgi:hypothetical protein
MTTLEAWGRRNPSAKSRATSPSCSNISNCFPPMLSSMPDLLFHERNMSMGPIAWASTSQRQSINRSAAA